MANTLKMCMDEAWVQLEGMKNKMTELARNLQHDWDGLDVKFKIIILVLGLLLIWFTKDKTVLFVVAVVIIIFFASSF